MSSIPHRAKHRAKSTAPRNGAAALLIGGLVAGTVATTGATRVAQNPTGKPGTTADLAGAARASTVDQAAPRRTTAAPELASFGSASLEQLRNPSAADRSEARSAPEDDAASVSTLLADSPFTGTTLEIEAPADPPQRAQTGSATHTEPIEQQPDPAPQQEATEQETIRAAQEPAQPLTQQEPAQPVNRQTATQQVQQQPAPAPVGGSLLDVAASYVGYPYVLYGTPPQAFDCSAYTWWVFKQAGIDIPRTVAGQKAAVTPVSDPQPGDLVFYNDWYHVGIYAGNGMTYEALNPNTDVRYGPLLSNNVWYGRIG